MGAEETPGDLSSADPSPNRAAAIRLAVFAVLVVGIAIVAHGLAVLIVVLALVAMVMLHEFGHFLTAKWSKMKVTEFYLGFGPKLWSVQRGETTYGIKAIPAGGYVRIIGMTMLEEVAPEDEARSYRQATFPRRFSVAVAGSAMHLVLAFILAFSILAFSGLPSTPTTQVNGFTKFANAANPAQAGGLRAGDIFVSMDGHKFTDTNSFIAFVQAHPLKTLTIVVRRSGHLVTLSVKALDARAIKVREKNRVISYLTPGSPATGVIGVHLYAPVHYVTTNPVLAVPRAGAMIGSVTTATISGIGQVFSLHGLRSFAHQVWTAGRTSTTNSSTESSGDAGQSGQLLSILGAVQIGAQAAQHNISELLYILIAINIFVGMVNLFPMLPLDGGHVAIAVYERLRSRKNRSYHADITKLMPVAYVFLAFMVVIGLGALYANIVQPVSLPGG